VTDEKSWPWLLGTRLTEGLGRRVLVANAGRSGHFTLHHAYQLRHYKLADQFGVIIILCGINDAGTLVRGNYEKRADDVPAEALFKATSRGAYYRNSYLVTALEALWTRLEIPASSIVQDPAGEFYAEVRQKRQRLLMRNPITSVPEELHASLETYRSNLIDIIELCSNRKQRLIFLTQPTLYHKDMPDDLAALLCHHTEDGAYTPEALAEVISAYNATLRSVCNEYNISCIALASQLPKDTSVFYDDVHFNVSGCDAVARILYEYLIGELRYQQTGNPGVAQPEAGSGRGQVAPVSFDVESLEKQE
jgi:lysophospholipase L1-like esterase